MKAKAQSEKMGRPRSFDAEKALDNAMRVFREKGYEGASLTDLTKAMGINRPSMYAAFGDKESLFRKVLERYSSGVGIHLQQALSRKTAREVAEQLLYGAAEMQTSTNSPRGCLLTTGALVCSDESDSVRRELTSLRRQNELAIRGRMKRAQAEGDLPADSNPADLARYLTAIMQGMSILATGGASRAELKRVVETALCAWPK